MYTNTDVNIFLQVVQPLVNTGAINSELFQVATNAIRCEVEGSAKAEEPALITRNKAAEILACSTRQIDRLCDAGKLSRVKYSDRAVRLRKSQVMQLMEVNHEQ
jgi:excisionase family DNA binding protein